MRPDEDKAVLYPDQISYIIKDIGLGYRMDTDQDTSCRDAGDLYCQERTMNTRTVSSSIYFTVMRLQGRTS